MNMLEANPQMNAPATIEPIFVPLKVASQICGYSVKTLYRMIEEGEIVAYGPRAKWVVKKADIIRFFESHKIVPSSTLTKVVKKKIAPAGVDYRGQGKTRNRS